MEDNEKKQNTQASHIRKSGASKPDKNHGSHIPVKEDTRDKGTAAAKLEAAQTGTG